MDIEERVQKATEAHIAGYNCVQSVLMGYEDLFDSMEDIKLLQWALAVELDKVMKFVERF